MFKFYVVLPRLICYYIPTCMTFTPKGGDSLAKGKHLLGMNGGRHIFGTVKVGEKGQIVIPKDAREIFGISSGDTLLILGDEKNGIIVTRPDVINEAAMKVFKNIDVEEK